MQYRRMIAERASSSCGARALEHARCGDERDDDDAEDASALLTPRFLLVVACGPLLLHGARDAAPGRPAVREGRLGGGRRRGRHRGRRAVRRRGAAAPVRRAHRRPFGRRVLIIGGACHRRRVSTAYRGWSRRCRTWSSCACVAGIGEAAFFVGAATMITDLAPDDRRGEAISYWSVAIYGGLAFGPALGEIVLGDDRFALDLAGRGGARAALAALLGVVHRRGRTARRRRRAAEPLWNRARSRPASSCSSACSALAGVHRVRPAVRRATSASAAPSASSSSTAAWCCACASSARALPDVLGRAPRRHARAVGARAAAWR